MWALSQRHEDYCTFLNSLTKIQRMSFRKRHRLFKNLDTVTMINQYHYGHSVYFRSKNVKKDRHKNSKSILNSSSNTCLL